MLLTSILRGADPHHRFSSLTLQRNVLVHLHQDNNNEPGFCNLIVPAAVGAADVCGFRPMAVRMLWTLRLVLAL